MGNCQAVDAAALVIQHPNGKLERMYVSVTASEVMKGNPGHYVSLIVPLPDQNRAVRVKLLRPADVLLLGHAYRLITTEEVMNVLRAKRHAKLTKKQSDFGEGLQINSMKKLATEQNHEMVIKPDRHRQRPAVGRPKSWQPSLRSISESGN